MRSLAQPEVLKSAVAAAFCSCLACYPRLLLWPSRPYFLWYLQALLFLCGIVLWAFVFAWFPKYSHRPVFTLRVALGPFVSVTLAAVAIALALHSWLDPALRLRVPEEFPHTLAQWSAIVLFALAYTQLYLIFAAFSWFLRLFQNITMATVLTVLFGLFVLLVKNHASPIPLSWPLLLGLVLSRVILAALSVYCFLRGGVLLAWWFGLLIQVRHLWTLDS